MKKPALVYIDSKYKKRIDKIKEKYSGDSEHFINRLENKYILFFAIEIALKNKSKPKKSKTKGWVIRTEYIKDETDTIMKGLIFSYKKDIKILLPENYSEYYELIETLANAGMDEALDILENKEELETLLLKKINTRKK